MDEQRLERFESMLEGVLRDYRDTCRRMDELKAQGKEKTAAFRQLMSNRLTCKTILSLYQVYGLLEENF